MLEPEETLKLIEEANDGNENALETLVRENMPLIKSVVRRYSGKSVEYEDLIQLGSLGLVKAVKNFNTAFNVRFSTYAVPMIAGEIKRFIRDDGSIKVSRALKVLSYKISKYISEFNQQNNREPTVLEIASEFEIDKEEVVFALDSNRSLLSLYDKSDDENNLSIIDKISVSYDDDEAIDKIILYELLRALPERDKKIVMLRFYRDKTQSEVAEILGVSQVQVSRLENKILIALREKFKIS